MALSQQGAEGQGLAGRPVDAGVLVDRLLLRGEQAGQGAMHGNALGHLGQLGADGAQLVERHGGGAATVVLWRHAKAGPAAFQPVGLVRLVGLGRLELLFQLCVEARHHALDIAIGQQPFLHQALGVDLPRGRVGGDLAVHQRLGERRLVGLVVAVPPVAEHVDDDILVELLPELGGDLADVRHRLRVVAVDVEDRRLHRLGQIRRIGRGARELRAGGEADLVVDDQVDGAAGAIAAQFRQGKAFRHQALAGERRVTVQDDRQDLGAVDIAHLRLLGARLAIDHRVHRLEVRRIGGQRQVHLVAVELAVRRGAEMVLHVARAFDIVGVRRIALELREDRLERLGHDIGQHRQAAAVRHAKLDVLQAQLAAGLDDGFHARDQGLAALQAKALGGGELDLAEALEALGLDQLVQDRLLAFRGEADFLLAALDALLQPALLVDVVDVHVLDADGRAVGALQDRENLAQARGLQTQHEVDENRAVHVRLGKAVAFRLQFRMLARRLEAQRVQVGLQVAADTVVADQHGGADRVQRRATNVGARGGRLLGRLLDLAAGAQQAFVVHQRQRLGPRRAALFLLYQGRVFRQRLEQLPPAGVDRSRVGRILGIQRLDVGAVAGVQERGRVELGCHRQTAGLLPRPSSIVRTAPFVRVVVRGLTASTVPPASSPAPPGCPPP